MINYLLYYTTPFNQKNPCITVCFMIVYSSSKYALVAELADASDSKSDAGDSVWVRVPPGALQNP